ncbi:PDZ domain-containing protein [Cohnella mopanensis]|uniref:PDZ domain-containing protein n=1 Tax=Cohnella mopanensis TaxID=2911966 RepID=UPI001EF8DE4E|nr:PDZ domain-containing protein [Cohnella mopanensis]
MPFGLKHTTTGTLLACVQRNGYKLAYYGLLLWEHPPELLEVSEALAEAGIAPGDEAGEVGDWEAQELSEHEAKIANVKLRNDPRRVVYYRDGVIAAAESVNKQ